MKYLKVSKKQYNSKIAEIHTWMKNNISGYQADNFADEPLIHKDGDYMIPCKPHFEEAFSKAEKVVIVEYSETEIKRKPRGPR